MASSSNFFPPRPTQFFPTGGHFPNQRQLKPLWTHTPPTVTAPPVSVPLDLTPTTLKSIEQSILEALGENVEERDIQESQQHSGNFVPPLPILCFRKKMLTRWTAEENGNNEGVGAGKTEPNSVAEANSPCSKTKGRPKRKSVVKQDDTQIKKVQVRKRTPKSKGKDAFYTNDKTAEEEEQCRVQRRREMNKLAAARCRKRRADRTTELTLETESLEADRSAMLSEIEELQILQEQLQTVLGNHPCAMKRARWEVRENFSNFNKSSARMYPCAGKFLEMSMITG